MSHAPDYATEVFHPGHNFKRGEINFIQVLRPKTTGSFQRIRRSIETLLLTINSWNVIGPEIDTICFFQCYAVIVSTNEVQSEMFNSKRCSLK